MNKPRKKKSPAQARLDAKADHIRRRYLDDLVGLVALANEIDVCVLSLTTWMDRNEVPRRGRLDAGAVRHRAFLERMKETYAEISRLRTDEKMTISAISEKLGVPQKTVSDGLSHAGLTGRGSGPKPPPKPLRGIARLYALRPQVEAAIAEGLSGRQLAARFTVSENSVYGWLKETGVRLSTLTRMQKRIISLWRTTDMNMNAIAAEIPCSRSNVGAVLRNAGLACGGKRGRPAGSSKGKRPPSPQPAEHRG